MQLRPEIQIKSILKAMSDVVLPALDPSNQLAQEQARLCMGLLELMSRQLPVQFRFDLDELGRLVESAGRLLDTPAHGEGSRQRLVDGARVASDVLDRARADPAEVLAAIRDLRAATSAWVEEACADARPDQFAAIERLVLDISRAQLLRDRSLLLMQRWEVDPAAVPPIDSLLPPAPSRSPA